jgi:hypothetical protein
MTVSTFTPPSVKCPECDSQAIVEYKPHVYHCLKCDFERDLSEPPNHDQESGGMKVALGIIGFALVMVLML